jgi:two-component system CheB/CheR fusion protein
MGITGTERVESYLDLLRERDEEVRALSKDLFIGVTSFFRETEAWAVIAEQIVAPIVAGHAGDVPVRVWVPGCATGEEAYTLAILFIEAFERAKKNINLLIFATDVDTEALQVARAGLYQENIAESLSPERLDQFFVKEGDGYRVKKPIRDLVVFTPQNLIADPPFSKLDLVSCRNLLIYLESRLQEKILRLFHFALNPDGFLILGSSESLGSQQREFRVLSKKWRLFGPDGPSQLGLMEMPVSRDAERSVPRFLARGLGRREPSLAEMAQQALVETFAPASVLVTRRHQVL